jgi:hypothetical protein
MKRILISALLVAFTCGECEAVAGKQLPSPPPAPEKKKVQKKKVRKLSRKETANLQKKVELDAKRHQVDMQRREFQMMQESQRRGMQQQQQMLQQKNKPQ